MMLTDNQLQTTYSVAHHAERRQNGDASALQAHLAGLRAVAERASHDGYVLRDALEPTLPEWVTHVEIELQGHDETWPNGTRMQEGMGETVATALADALGKDGE